MTLEQVLRACVEPASALAAESYGDVKSPNRLKAGLGGSRGDTASVWPSCELPNPLLNSFPCNAGDE